MEKDSTRKGKEKAKANATYVGNQYTWQGNARRKAMKREYATSVERQATWPETANLVCIQESGTQDTLKMEKNKLERCAGW